MRDYKHCNPQQTYTLSEAGYEFIKATICLIFLFALMAELFLFGILLAPAGAV